MVLPVNHPFYIGIFHEINQPVIGVPFVETPCGYNKNKVPTCEWYIAPLKKVMTGGWFIIATTLNGLKTDIVDGCSVFGVILTK